MEASLYGVIGLAIVWVGTIARLYLQGRRQDKEIKANGKAVQRTDTQVALLTDRVIELEQDRDHWQYRALKAENEIREANQRSS